MLSSRKSKILWNINLTKKEYFDLLPLVNLYDFCLEKAVTCYFDLLGHFSCGLTVISTQNCSTLINKVSFGLKDRKLIKKLRV